MIPPDQLCQKRGCPRAATHLLKLHVPAVGGPAEVSVAQALLGVKLCEEHLDEDDPMGWVTGATGGYIRGALSMATRGAAPADFARAWTEGVPLASPEAQALNVHSVRPVH